MRQLMKHQQKALGYAKPLARVALFMEMRLGKTLVSIRWVEHNRMSPVLVVTPKSVIPTWVNELLEEGYAYEDIQIIDRSGEAEWESEWCITNYERVLASPSILNEYFEAIILDESTRIRNPKAKITKLLNTKTKIGYRMILSGHPCPESPLDYFEQMRFLHGSFMHQPLFWHWRKKYFMQLGYDWVPTKETNRKIKEALEDRAFTMTRKEAGIGSKKIFEKRYVEFSPEQKKLYEQINREFEYEYREEEKNTKYVVAKIQWMHRVCGGFTPEGILLSDKKVKEIYELLSGELKGEKVVIWFKYNLELIHVNNYLIKKGFKVGAFMGKTKSGVNARGKIKNDVQILLAQPKCGMYGQDWSDSSTSIYYSNWFDGEIRKQSVDRIIHPKKKEPVLILDLITKDSMDEDVLELLSNKGISSSIFMSRLSEKLREKREISIEY